jgi:hypothetical protein
VPDLPPPCGLSTAHRPGLSQAACGRAHPRQYLVVPVGALEHGRELGVDVKVITC